MEEAEGGWQDVNPLHGLPTLPRDRGHQDPHPHYLPRYWLHTRPYVPICCVPGVQGPGR
jgi:hypothetical protein